MKKFLSRLGIILITVLALLLSACSSFNEEPDKSSTSLKISELLGAQYEGSRLVVHFIDVGQGDCSLLECDGEAMMIDGGDNDASDIVYTYLKKNNIGHLKYIIATHPDSDHIGGLSGALNAVRSVEQAFCSELEYDTKTFKNFKANLAKKNTILEVPTLGSTFSLGSASFQIIGPFNSGERNENSIVVRVTFGETSFLFMGDADHDEENDLMKSKYEIESDVIKIGHHGSADSTSKKFLKKVNPSFATISSGKKNQYRHPHEETLALLKKEKINLFRTDMQGDVVFVSDGKEIKYATARNDSVNTFITFRELYEVPNNAKGIEDSSADNSPKDSKNASYVLNSNTYKFHLPSCRHVSEIEDDNRIDFEGTRQEVIDKGYSPCGTCRP